jgi:hypothetical protein
MMNKDHRQYHKSFKVDQTQILKLLAVWCFWHFYIEAYSDLGVNSVDACGEDTDFCPDDEVNSARRGLSLDAGY